MVDAAVGGALVGGAAVGAAGRRVRFGKINKKPIRASAPNLRIQTHGKLDAGVVGGGGVRTGAAGGTYAGDGTVTVGASGGAGV